VLCLTLHANYRCRHSGACCEQWTVAAEPRVIELVAARQILSDAGPLFVSSGDPGISPTVARHPDGSCVFLDRGAGRVCVIHREAGAGALPEACRHFPRRFLRDGRGTFVSLSHFCPTAAGMLLEADPLRIVEAGPPLRLDEPIEGLDATAALPPLVRPGILTDLPGYSAWEGAALATLARPDLDCRQSLDAVAGATERVRRWRPGSASLAACVEAAFRDARAGDGCDPDAGGRVMEAVRSVVGGVATGGAAPLDQPDASRERRVAEAFQRFDAAIKNYLAARLFANWVAYQGRGLRSIVEWLRACAAVLRGQLLLAAGDAEGSLGAGEFVEGVRKTDLLLLHGADPLALARRLSACEGPDPR
jgi:hypothetical protein